MSRGLQSLVGEVKCWGVQVSKALRGWLGDQVGRGCGGLVQSPAYPRGGSQSHHNKGCGGCPNCSATEGSWGTGNEPGLSPPCPQGWSQPLLQPGLPSSVRGSAFANTVSQFSQAVFLLFYIVLKKLHLETWAGVEGAPTQGGGC